MSPYADPAVPVDFASQAARCDPLADTVPALAPRQLMLLCTDLENFTPTVERLGDTRAQRLLHVHNRILRAALRCSRGREVTHTGDGILAAFQDVTNGIRCAIEIQREFAAHNRVNPQLRLRIRIGAHVGAPLPEEGRLFGLCVNLTMRVCMHADGESILVSDALREIIPSHSGVSFRDAGEFHLKGIGKPARLHLLLWR